MELGSNHPNGSSCTHSDSADVNAKDYRGYTTAYMIHPLDTYAAPAEAADTTAR